MPWNSWCGTCSAHIGAGVRYNAEKKRQGSYLSTPIWGFRCKCHLCSGWFEIRTDPQVSHRFLLALNGEMEAERGEDEASREAGRWVASRVETDSLSHRCILSLVRQNAQYVVHEGLKKKLEDWDPEENGGYAVHGAAFLSLPRRVALVLPSLFLLASPSLSLSY